MNINFKVNVKEVKAWCLAIGVGVILGVLISIGLAA
jgi:hypothetical protein